MKLALAFVAALSLVGCATDSNDPGEGLYGVGIGKALQTDPSDVVPVDFEQNAALAGRDPGDFATMLDTAQWVENLPENSICDDCQLVGLHVATAQGREEVYIYDGDGTFKCRATLSNTGAFVSGCNAWFH